MPGDDVYELYIDVFTPATISMSRLAEYMRVALRTGWTAQRV